MTSRRIAIYTSSFPPKGGGIAAAHFNLYEQLSKQHDVKAFVFRDSETSESKCVVRGIPFPGMKATFRGVLRKLLRKPIRQSLPNCDAIAETAASVVQMNGELRRFAPDLIICPDHYLPALMLKKPRGSKLAWMARHNYLRFAEQRLTPPPDFDDLHLAHRLELRSLRKADILISPSQYMCDLFQRMFGSCLPAHVASNFVNAEKLASIGSSNLRQLLNVTKDIPIIYIPSGGSDIKGARYLFEIVRRLGTNTKLAAYIPGFMSPVLHYELQSLAPHIVVHAPGRVSYDENLAHVAGCDLTISPTLVENLSNALVESIMLGVPVVTFDTGGNKEIIQSEKTGCIVPYGDVESLIKASDKFLTHPEELHAMREICRRESRRIVDREQINTIYENIIAAL